MLGWTPTGKTLGRRIEAFVPRLFRIARSWGCNAELAHELVQETVVTALSKIKQLRKESALESWLISILANSHRGHLRRAQRTLNLDDRDLVVEETPDDALAREDVVQRVRQAIGTLTDHHRKVITLVDMEGMSYAEVAEALEIRVGTVMSRLARARAQLRERLRDELSGNTATAGTVARLRRVR